MTTLSSHRVRTHTAPRVNRRVSTRPAEDACRVIPEQAKRNITLRIQELDCAALVSSVANE